METTQRAINRLKETRKQTNKRTSFTATITTKETKINNKMDEVFELMPASIFKINRWYTNNFSACNKHFFL